MRYPKAAIIYFSCLMPGLFLAGLSGWKDMPLLWPKMLIYGIGALLLAAASYLMALMSAGLLFPAGWRQGRMSHADLEEWNTFTRSRPQGPRISWFPRRLFTHGSPFLRQWDKLLALLLAGYLAAHLAMAATAWQTLDRIMPHRSLFPESIHQPFLTRLPAVETWGLSGGSLEAITRRARQELQRQPVAEDAQGLLMAAQTRLLAAFHHRQGLDEPFRHQPGDAVWMDPDEAMEALYSLEKLQLLPQEERAGRMGGALALTGFIQLALGKNRQAEETLTQAVAGFERQEASGIPRHMALLLKARAHMQTNQIDDAQRTLKTLLSDDRFPPLAHALAMEMVAEIDHLGQKENIDKSLLAEVAYNYQKENDQAGLGRIHLRQAALAFKLGQRKRALRELSQANSQALAADDWFTQNMISQVQNQYLD